MERLYACDPHLYFLSNKIVQNGVVQLKSENSSLIKTFKMKQLKLLFLIILYSTIAKATGGCGSGLEIRNPTWYSKIISINVDTIRRELNPTDSTIVFGLYIFEGNCDVVNAHWFKNGNPITDGLNCTAVGPGIYRVKYQTDAPYITNYDVVIIFTAKTTGVDDLTNKLAPDFQLFPNPSISGLFTMERETAEPCSIKIYDLTGHVIKEQQMVDAHVVTDISGFEKGMYVLELTTTNGFKRRKKMVFN